MNALKSFADGSRSGKRNQTVYTPQSIVDALLRLWPEGIAMDPCSGPDSIVPALWNLMPPINGCKYDKKAGPAFIEYWPERTYVNPEFDNLQPWILQFCESIECVLLVPVRTHRKWWRDLLRCGADICWLDPLRFVGYEQSFPAPLALCYRGVRDFEAAVDGLGEVLS